MDGRCAVFLDRDGTINVEVSYLHRPADLKLIPGAVATIRRLNLAGYVVVVVTNQAGIARGLYGEADMHMLHAHLDTLLAAEGARLDAWYWCPHHPLFTGPCACRKPGTAMLEAAAADHGLDLGRSWLIGDSAGDIGAGEAAGCRTILVRTGYGAALETTLRAGHPGPHPEVVVDALPDAVDYLLEASDGR